MKKNQKGKTAVIVTGILFAASLIFLIVVLILNFSSGKGGEGKEESNGEIKPSIESILNPQTDSQPSEESAPGESNAKESQDSTQGQSGNGTQGQSESGIQGQTESEEVKDSLSLKNGKNNKNEGAQQPLEPYSENMKELYSELSDYTEEWNGDWAIYAEDLSDGSYMLIDKNGEKMPAASLIKLFIMAAVYEKIDEGILKETELVKDIYGNTMTVQQAVEQMITVSSNEASNALIRLLADGKDDAAGREAVNQWIKKNGYNETVLGRILEENGVIDTSQGDNYTSVEDCADFLKSIYSGECISEEISEKMAETLKNQTRNEKIPQGIPAGTECAHKTGELSNSEHDAAIIYTADKDYILCVMSANIDSGTAKDNIRVISEIVYEHMAGVQ